MQNKLVGLDIDKQIHYQMLSNFTNFIQNFSPLLDSAEKYSQVISSMKLLESNDIVDSKCEIIENICQTLSQMVPLFVQFSILEDKLEKLNFD